MQDEVAKRIEHAATTGASNLDLAGLKLEQLPKSIAKLQQLESLFIVSNNLTKLPAWIGELTKLKLLIVSRNRLSELPKELGALTKLKHLDVGRNHLTGLPKSIERLQQLRKLRCSGNGIIEVPTEVGNLAGLRQLDMSGNSLTSIPESISLLSELRQLWLDANELTFLSEASLPISLESLNLSGNNFTRVPVGIERLERLRELGLASNKLTSVPEDICQLRNLKWLDIGHNAITELPLSFASLPESISYFRCEGNPLVFPPRDIEWLGGEPCLRYLRALTKGEETVWQSKVLLVGEGNVGKTWLYEALSGRLRGGQRKDDRGTIGIDVGPLNLSHPTKRQIEMRLNVWDFAGQEINHATHQFFFSNRTLFLLVWSARAGIDAGKVARWLSNIRDRAPQGRVILVASQWDAPHNDYQRDELRKAFPQIVETIEVSSCTGEGIDELRELVRTNAAELPMMGLRWPTTWRTAAQALQAMRIESPHTTLTKVQGVLHEHRVTNDDCNVLLRWLHELGEILHYEEPSELADRVVLDPQWVTRHVGELLASRAVAETDGVVTQGCLKQVWEEHEESVRMFLLGLMEAFDLAYRIPDDPQHRTLVVERLPEDPIEYRDLWDPMAGGPELRLRLRLASLHPGIPTWFIARCHRFTQKRHWRRGVLFGDDRQSPRHRALIIANEFERKVDFIVRGPFPYSFMPLLLDGFFATVDKRYPGLRIEKKVPCPGKHRDGRLCTHEFSLEELEGLLVPKHKDDEAVYRWRCMQCRTDHSVEELLRGVSFAPISGEITLHRLADLILDQGAETREHIDVGFNQLREWWQLEFVRQWNAEQLLEEQSCPTVFALYPIGKGTLFRSEKLHLQLYCMQPGCWHSMERDGACQFAPPREQLVKIAGFLRKWARWLKPAAVLFPKALPVAYAVSGIATTLSENLKNEFELTQKALEELEKIPEAITEIPSVPETRTVAPRLHSDSTLAAFKQFISERDFPEKPYGGLQRVRTPEEHILWLCPEHARKFRREI